MPPPALGPAELALLETAVAEDPGSRLFLRLARAYAQADRLTEARETLQRGLALQPAEVEGHGLLAEVLERQGDPQGALSQLAGAAALLSRHADLYQYLAGLLARQGRDEEVLVARRLAQDLRTDFLVAKARSQAPPAIQEAQGSDQALQDTPTLAEIYAAQGFDQKAADIYRRLLALDPGNQRLAQRLAQLESRPPASPGQGPDPDLLAGLEALRGAALDRAGGRTDDQELLALLEALQGAALERAGGTADDQELLARLEALRGAALGRWTVRA